MYKIFIVKHRNVYSVHFVCTLFGRKMQAVLIEPSKIVVLNSWLLNGSKWKLRIPDLIRVLLRLNAQYMFIFNLVNISKQLYIRLSFNNTLTLNKTLKKNWKNFPYSIWSWKVKLQRKIGPKNHEFRLIFCDSNSLSVQILYLSQQSNS